MWDFQLGILAVMGLDVGLSVVGPLVVELAVVGLDVGLAVVGLAVG
jgi:hypothetical protein